jgi:cysteine-rich repeat protein
MDSTITGNGTGAQSSSYDRLTLLRTVVSDNGQGVSAGSTAFVIDSCAIINNGGGIWGLTEGGGLGITNSTISGNGNGIFFITEASIGLENVTVTNNVGETSPGVAVGVYVRGGYFGFDNTIIAGNRDTAGEPSDCGVDDSFPSGSTLSGNLIENIGNCPSDGVIVGVDPLLGPLRDNGGPTPTQALLPGSPAIDAGGGGCPAVDQRGVSRPQFAACDLGAYELACGNGTIDLGESCDDGPANGTPGSCCSSTCAVEPAGTPCTDDGSLCTTDLCDGSGTCTHPYEPDPSCTTPATWGATLRVISRPGVAGADQVQFKWSKGPAVPLSAFGSPGGSTSYAFCVYDATASGPVPTYQGQPGGQCDVEPCWSSSPMGWKFTSKSGVPDGITSMTLKEGLMPGMARMEVRAKGLLSLETLPLQMSPNVIAQVRTGEGQCWGATFSTAMRNASGQFIGRSD